MPSKPEPSNCAFTKDESTPCNKCGRFGALEVNGQWLCDDCYALCGSCCSGFEGEKSD